ncbi:hypothetical protein AJ87_26605 [Rhizobium yanglingense]|nr:hypothetical protein AJ87_26605 [Rhizobium yanglingense]
MIESNRTSPMGWRRRLECPVCELCKSNQDVATAVVGDSYGRLGKNGYPEPVFDLDIERFREESPSGSSSSAILPSTFLIRLSQLINGKSATAWVINAMLEPLQSPNPDRFPHARSI